jgi:uncharacterized protein with HEPN domain
VLRSAVLLLEDIKKSCERIVRYTAGLTRDEVFVDEMRFDAVLFNLHIIGGGQKATSRAAGEVFRYLLAGDRRLARFCRSRLLCP